MFYPSHDIALGNGIRHFNPPAAALQLQEDLAWLSEIWNTGDEILPWGWDWDTRLFLRNHHHIKEKDLPSDEQLEAIRQLSSRRTTRQILEALQFEGELPCYLDSAEALDDYISSHDNSQIPFVFKTPWSSSGRGLIRSNVTPRGIMRQRALSTIRKMGGIMGERWYNKVQDFAMLFKVTHTEVLFLGYSLFENEESGTYRQGYLLSNGDIEQRLGLIPQLHDLQQRLVASLTPLFSPFFHLPWQLGYVGIDMMLYRDDKGEVCIHPCVEMNVRCTMGTVCRLWSDKHLCPGQEGRFIISPLREDGHFTAHFELTK